MQKQTVFLFHDDPELLPLFEKTLQQSNIPCEGSSYEKASHSSHASTGNRMVLFETGKEDKHSNLLSNVLKSDLKKTLIIIGPSKFLRRTAPHIEELSHSLAHEGDREERLSKEKAVYVEDFLESKLKAFIKKNYSAKKSTLYNTLLQEFERPLITLTLKETNGNQIQAAEILGLNRNTLRKKIQELKIQVKNLKSHKNP
jgi:DNA-binding protein Fis